MTPRLLFTVLAILVLPVAIASMGYQWHWQWFPLLDLDDTPALLAYGLTLSVGKYGIAITLVALSLLALRRWRHRPGLLLMFFFCLMAALGSAFVTKTLAKQYFKEPRPYVLWLAEKGRLADSDRFYAQLPSIREKWLADGLREMPERQVPGWLKLHWQDEVSYSFPSGHSIAAMTIAGFYCLLLLYRRRSPWLIGALATWAVAVCYSRLLLGLHWPVDILASSVLGVMFGMLGAWAFIRWDQR
ncbi:phosphatase PAP2 family protein [Oceanisphaera arctica]|uniref:undecaprenyl-diphosphate phosphatase n=1 Tax=Oceanisphaera arctica TaxID=641510 RepID=A0A2P5TPR0_9GAMM|nr:phosphatase PAP2 family protein [Oceanisphaera arctica]PPL17699.1 phosphatidylglycerophosphatase [Oceanisphaera arctica]GHA18614.1 phosphatidylglycerophosphatase B [Oceanisphaera arctica]